MKAEVVHLDKKGQVVLGKRASRTQKRGMAQTYAVSWKDAETQTITTLPITQYGLGRRVRGTIRYCKPLPLAGRLSYHTVGFSWAQHFSYVTEVVCKRCECKHSKSKR